MAAKLPWIQRKFTFDYPVEIWPDIVERFRGTPARIEALIGDLPQRVLTDTDGQGWSIQENIGHLLDLEPLWDRRIDDYLADREMLSAADITNQGTRDARHNEKRVDELLDKLRKERARMTARVEQLSDADFARVSIHPRLQIKMRLVDALKFVCDHDDYHLARISELKRKLG